MCLEVQRVAALEVTQPGANLLGETGSESRHGEGNNGL